MQCLACTDPHPVIQTHWFDVLTWWSTTPERSEALWSTHQTVKKLIMSSKKRPVNQLQYKKKTIQHPESSISEHQSYPWLKTWPIKQVKKLFGSFYQSSHKLWVFPPIMDIDQPPARAWLPHIEDKHGQDLCWAARKHETQPSWIIGSWYPDSYRELIVPTHVQYLQL